MTSEQKNSPRRYPPLYEKIVPVILIILGIAITVVLIIAFGVLLGLIA
ncbi:MAG: hypothetical protein HN392_13155 [Anaerolineae bacterium]|jgi:hypothetical protein|nr:hypothetical protein [Anaerolineae bacterium]